MHLCAEAEGSGTGSCLHLLLQLCGAFLLRGAPGCPHGPCCTSRSPSSQGRASPTVECSPPCALDSCGCGVVPEHPQSRSVREHPQGSGSVPGSAGTASAGLWSRLRCQTRVQTVQQRLCLVVLEERFLPCSRSDRCSRGRTGSCSPSLCQDRSPGQGEHQSLLPAAHLGLWAPPVLFSELFLEVLVAATGKMLLSVSKGTGLFSQCQLQPLLGRGQFHSLVQLSHQQIAQQILAFSSGIQQLASQKGLPLSLKGF